MLPFAKVFSLANEMFFDFRESFLREIRPKNYYSRKFLSKISRFFDLAKVSARETKVDRNSIKMKNLLKVKLKFYEKTPLFYDEFSKLL